MNNATSLPTGWIRATLSDLAHYVTSGSRDWSKFYADEGALFLRTQDINTNRLLLDRVAFVKLPERVEGKRSLVETRDILITITGANVGKCALVQDSLPEAYVSQSVALVKLDESANGRYVQLACLRPLRAGRTLLQELAYGLGRPVLSLKQIRSLSIPLPPLPEQARIVAKIDALQVRSAAAKETLDAIPPLLKKFRQSVLAAAFRGDLTREWRERHPGVEPASELLERLRAERRRRWVEVAVERGRARAEARARKAGKPWGAEQDAAAVGSERTKAGKKYQAPEPADESGLPGLPEGWCWAGLDELCDGARSSSYGVLKPGPHVEGGVRLLKSHQVREGVFDLRADYRISSALDEQYRRTRLHGGELLLTIVGSIGRAAVADESVAGANVSRALAMLPVSPASPHWALWALLAPYAQGWMKKHAGGTSQPVLNLGEVRRIPVPLAPETEQGEVLRLLRDHLDRHLRVTGAYEQAASMTSGLDASVLAKAFRGELVPQNPDDEPASILLDRIRSERAQATGRSSERKRVKRRVKKPTMRSVRAAIRNFPNARFTLDDLRRLFPSDEDELRRVLYALLAASDAGIHQIFDEETGSIRLERDQA